MVSGGWISWNYNQLSQAKAEAETEFVLVSANPATRLPDKYKFLV